MVSRLRAVGPPCLAPPVSVLAGRRSVGAGPLPRGFLSKGEETARRPPATPPRDAGRLLPPPNDLDRQPARWTFLSDPGRRVQKDLDIAEYTDPDHNPMIPHTL